MKDSLRCLLALVIFVAISTPAWAQIVFGGTDTLQNDIHAFAFAVPEPATWGLICLTGIGLLGGIYFFGRRRKTFLDREYDEDELFEE